MPTPPPDSRRLHLQLVRNTVGRHLAEIHRLPEELADRDDQIGMLADHVHLHGGHVQADGRIVFPKES